MISVYVEFNNQPKPALVAEFYDQAYADILVTAGNNLFNDGRNFYSEADEVTADDEFDIRALHMTPDQIKANDAGVDGSYFK